MNAMNVNEISIDRDGNCTVIGSIAHELWKSGQYPKLKVCRQNNFYVVKRPIEGFLQWDIRAAQSTRALAMNYLDSESVLVDVTDAPKG